MNILTILRNLDRLLMAYSILKRMTSTIRLINRLFKIIALFPTPLSRTLCAERGVVKGMYKLSQNPTFLTVRKTLVWLSLVLTIITVCTSMEPLTDLNNIFVTSLASLNLLLTFYSERIYLFLINFLMRRVENPAKIIEMIEENYVRTELVFHNRVEMEEYLRNNPEKRLLSPSFLSPQPSPDRVELEGATILGGKTEEEKGGFTKTDYLILSIAVTLFGVLVYHRHDIYTALYPEEPVIIYPPPSLHTVSEGGGGG